MATSKFTRRLHGIKFESRAADPNNLSPWLEDCWAGMRVRYMKHQRSLHVSLQILDTSTADCTEPWVPLKQAPAPAQKRMAGTEPAGSAQLRSQEKR